MAFDLFAGLPETPKRSDTRERLFFGVMLPEPQAEAALDVLDQSRANHDLRGSAIRRDRLHVTLIHVGDYAGVLPPATVEAAVNAGNAMTSPGFDVVFDHVSSFSGAPGKHPHVLLSDKGVEAMKAFRADLLKSVVRCGLKPLSRQDFTPHVTLSYADRRLPERPIKPIAWRPEEFVLIHSEVGRSVYHTLGRWPFR